MKHGFLLVDKPVGPTSHDIVEMVRKQLHETHIGHLGTLDPAASGLLVMAVGSKALKCIELFQNGTKAYEAEITLGAVSTTYDREGVIESLTPKAGWMVPDDHTIMLLIADRFIGKIKQVPPEASAVKIGGERAYRKFRQGRGVNIPPREVEITECAVVEYAYPHLKLRVRCGSGTYIRSLAHDLGASLKCGGYLANLRRIKVGEWRVGDSHRPDCIAWGHVIPLKEVLKDFSSIELTEAQAENIRHGRDIVLDSPLSAKDTIAWLNDLPIAILTPRNDGTELVHARKVL
ncbi:tRNA pseudouridine(55) synthase TruB [Candidatus Peregrinibacteria bacterium]|nr:tRNA pseudouridine(55) synthase TruB [Candidatus Peregrinibacteria bacterium]